MGMVSELIGSHFLVFKKKTYVLICLTLPAKTIKMKASRK